MSNQKKFAVIWWLKICEKDVVNLSVIPKNSRHINQIVKLMWKDFQTQQETKAEAKILAISSKLTFYQTQLNFEKDRNTVIAGSYSAEIM